MQRVSVLTDPGSSKYMPNTVVCNMFISTTHERQFKFIDQSVLNKLSTKLHIRDKKSPYTVYHVHKWLLSVPDISSLKINLGFSP